MTDKEIQFTNLEHNISRSQAQELSSFRVISISDFRVNSHLLPVIPLVVVHLPYQKPIFTKFRPQSVFKILFICVLFVKLEQGVIVNVQNLIELWVHFDKNHI